MILRSSSLPTAGVPIWPSQLRLPCSFKRMLGDETPQFEAAHANASFTGVANDAPLRHILSFRSLETRRLMRRMLIAAGMRERLARFWSWPKPRRGFGCTEPRARPLPDFEGHGHLNSITRMRSAVFYAARLFDRRKQIRGPAVALWGALLLSAGLRLTGVAPSVAGEADPARQDLDHIAYAVAGAESSHGTNPAMWRPNLAGPQGPMQVSEKAARDVGGGDRFDIAQNRAIGRAYLALLYRRYANWPDAVSAYNWGIGKFDRRGDPHKNWCRRSRCIRAGS
jgi:hypothetical protein